MCHKIKHFILLILCGYWFMVTNGGVIASEATTHHHPSIHSGGAAGAGGGGSKERLNDGSYARRDSSHHGPDGEHNAGFDHEVIAGSVKDAEEFDQLSPEESKKRLAQLVVKMDLNLDEFIDRHELKAWILRSFKRLAEEEADERFEYMDENKDHEITWKEYLLDTYGFEDENQQEPLDLGSHSNEENKLIADDRKLFNTADLNGDGVLRSLEFMAFITPEEFPHMLPAILEQTLRDKDLDGDGKINFQEFVGDSSSKHDKEWLIAEKEKFDTDYDRDGDGILNRNEILSWVVPSNDEVAEDEVEHLFASSDVNHDDRLSYEEIIDNYEIFVGSEVTDYGDHLKNIKDEL